MQKRDTAEPTYVRSVVLALVFGVAALATVLAQLTLPIPGTAALTDPREIFVTVGAALSGPVGSPIVGALAGVAEPDFPLASTVGHVAGALWMAVVYKFFVYRRSRLSVLLLSWALVIVIYYYVIIVPIYVIALDIFYASDVDFVSVYGRIAGGALPEVLVTTLVTTLTIYALPGLYRRPLS